MKNLKNVILIMLIIFSISVIFASCNKGAFQPAPLEPTNPDWYLPKDTPVPVPNFKIYSWIRYNNTPGKVSYDVNTQQLTISNPDMSGYRIYPFFIINPTWLFDKIPGTTSTDNNLTYGIINDIKFQGVALATASYVDRYVQLDAEAWSTWLTGNQTPGPVGNIHKTKDSLIKSIEIFKKYNSTSKIGFYGLLPVNVYNFGNIDNDTKYQNWQQQNDILKDVYDKVDVFFPSCYTRTSMVDSIGWKKYALANIDEIRRISPTKPIIMGLSLQYSENRKYVEPDYLKYQLETLLADSRIQGVFYWTSDTVVNDDGSKVVPTFNKDMPWFKTIQQVITKHNIQ